MNLKHRILTSSFVMLALFFLYLVVVNRMAQKPAPSLTLKGTYSLLKERVKIPDLVYMSFDSQDMKANGTTKRFLITGCSPSQNRTYYMLSNGSKLNPPRSLETKACKPTLPYNRMMDSPQVLEKVKKATGKSCSQRIIYKMDWDDPEALILCWDSKKKNPLWQVVIDTVSGEVKAVYPKKEEKQRSKTKSSSK